MKMKIRKINNEYIKAFNLFIILLALIMIVKCTATDAPEPTSPIFADVERIEIISPNDGASNISDSDYLRFNVPSEVHIIVVGIFNQDIETAGQQILNEDNFVAGSRTGLSGFSRDQVQLSKVYPYDSITNDFDDSTNFNFTNATYYWAVWGYDKYGNLTHASARYRFKHN